MRDALTIRATIPTHTERTAEDRLRRSVGTSVKEKHLFVKIYRLRGRWVQIFAEFAGAWFAVLELVQHILLKCQSRNGSGRDDRQRDANPFTIEEEEQFIVNNRTAQTAPKMIHSGSRLLPPRYRVREIVGC